MKPTTTKRRHDAPVPRTPETEMRPINIDPKHEDRTNTDKPGARHERSNPLP